MDETKFHPSNNFLISETITDSLIVKVCPSAEKPYVFSNAIHIIFTPLNILNKTNKCQK